MSYRLDTSNIERKKVYIGIINATHVKQLQRSKSKLVSWKHVLIIVILKLSVEWSTLKMFCKRYNTQDITDFFSGIT